MTYTIGKAKSPAFRDESGLTLIEMCLVLLLLGLLVAAATPRLARSYQALKLKTAAESLAREMKVISRRALLVGQRWQLTIAADGRSYGLAPQKPREETNAAALEEQACEWQPARRRFLPEGITLAPADTALVWGLNGALSPSALTLTDEQARVFEINLEGTRITIQPP
jgi:type II secretion system protein H